jgi:hypothetical protein
MLGITWTERWLGDGSAEVMITTYLWYSDVISLVLYSK